MNTRLLVCILALWTFAPAFSQKVSASDIDDNRDGIEVCKGDFSEEKADTSANKNLVRLSKITVDPAQLDNYNAFLKEEIEASIRLEPGVLTLYAMAEKEHPNKITILEIYAGQEAYKSHIQTPHFQKYKQGTLKMVQALELIDCNPLIPGLKIKITSVL